MRPEIVMRHEFVEFIPENLQEQTLYISETYGTAVHKCCCGCGREVVTPLSPTGWRLAVTGDSVSLYPSIGSWSLACRSHYWIRNNRVVWAEEWTDAQVARGRAREAVQRERYLSGNREGAETVNVPDPAPNSESSAESLWQMVKRWLFG